MGFVGTGNQWNHWSNEIAIEYLKRHNLSYKDFTPRERIKKASDHLYGRKLEKAKLEGLKVY